MKFTLKDYQHDAVIDVLKNLKKVRKLWHEDGDRHAFSLTAATGAGKTVMAAAVSMPVGMRMLKPWRCLLPLLCQDGLSTEDQRDHGGTNKWLSWLGKMGD
jgi:hypothetical protein